MSRRRGNPLVAVVYAQVCLRGSMRAATLGTVSSPQYGRSIAGALWGFLGAGVVGWIGASRLGGDTRWIGVGLLTLAGLIGVGSARAVVTAMAHRRYEERMPSEPWRWRSDWSRGYVADDSVQSLYYLGGAALVVNLIAVPSLVVPMPEFWAEGLYLVLAAGIFVGLVGALLTLGAAHSLLHLCVYGRTRFESSHFPGRIGATLQGTLRGGRIASRSGAALQAKLACARTDQRGETPEQSCVWQDEKQLKPAADGIPVHFEIPDGLPPSSMDEHLPVTWTLTVSSGPVAGPDFQVEFEVPVFSTSDVAPTRNVFGSAS